MATVQSSYSETMNDGVAGQIATSSPCIIDSYVVDNGQINGIDFGYAVRRHGDSADEIEIGAGGGSSAPFAVTEFLGVAVKSPGVGSTNTADDNQYDAGDHASILSQGDVWVPVVAAVTAGGVVTVNGTTGQFSSVTAADGQFLVTGAVWRTSQATAGGLAVLRLTGAIAG